MRWPLLIDKKALPVTFAVAAGLYLAQHGLPQSNGWIDVTGFFLFCGLMYLLLRERGSAEQAHAHESAAKSFAFRLGKALNRVIRRFRRGA